jgi:hypothetical protein
MPRPSAAAMRYLSRRPMPRYSDGVATRGRPILADTREPDAAGAVGIDARSAFTSICPLYHHRGGAIARLACRLLAIITS